MSTSAASPSDDHRQSTAHPYGDAPDSVCEPEIDDDEEYEEIEEEVEVEEEIEEEVEVEEEEEEEEDEEEAEVEEEVDDDDEIGEDLSPVDEDRRNDVIELEESKGHQEQLKSDSTTDKSVEIPRAESLILQDGSRNSENSGPKTSQNEEAPTDDGVEVSKCQNIGEPVACKDHDSNVLPVGIEIMNPEGKPFLSYPGEEVTAASVNGEHTNSMVPRLDAPRKDHDSNVSPVGLEIMNPEGVTFLSYPGEEVTAASINGEHTNSMVPRLGVPRIRQRSLSPAAANSEEGNKRAAVICDFFAKGWCIKGSSCRFLHVKNQKDVSSRLSEESVGAVNEKTKPPSEEGLRGGSGRSPLSLNSWTNSFKDVGKDSQGQNRLSDSLGNYASHGIPYEEMAGRRSWSTGSERNFPSLTPSLHRSSTSLPSAWSSGSHLSFKTKISFDDWEPSVPFRPSFFLTQTLSSPGSQYDPIRDSIDQPIGFAKLTSHIDSTLTGAPGPSEGSSDQHHIYGLQKLKSEKPEGTKANETSVDHKLGIQKAESKLDQARQSTEIGSNHNTNGDEHKEPRTVRHFRAALVDFVKELVKPTWREGLLSKDAHKTIVKRAVEKVLSTLPSHQIPNTGESIKLYLSSSQPKISKLVEAYVDKYGKT